MKRRMIGLGFVGVLSGGFLLLEAAPRRTVSGDIVEERVSANLIRVRIRGQWEEFPLMPLAHHSCRGGRLLDACPDRMVAPGAE